MKDRSATFLAVVLLAISLSIPGFGFTEEIAAPVEGAAAYPDGLVYTVVEGDTLWDLSAKYLGSPWKWTELWERNRFVTNPHYIYPGIQIVIFPPPGKEFALPLPESAAAATGGEAAKPVKIQAPASAVSKPPTLDIAPSDLVRAGEFVRESPKGIGRILGGEEPKVAFSEGDTVFLRLDKAIPAGQLLGVYRVRGPITAPGDRPVTGYAVYLVGLIQATGKRDGVSAGVVRNSFEDLGREDILREEIPSYAPVVMSGGRGKLEARVLAGQWENEELATGNFIFLDRGAAAGVAMGDVFRLFDEAEMSGEGVPGGAPNVSIGVADAVIVRVSPEFSTGYVTRSMQSLAAGGKAIRGGAGAK